MREEFIKETKIVDKSEEEKERELYQEIEVSKKKLKAYYDNLNFASGNLIDYYTYQIKAEEAKFSYLMKEIRNYLKDWRLKKIEKSLEIKEKSALAKLT